MGNTDSIPVVSQVKSGVQLVCGDTDGAARTQENFLKECPVVSQVTSTVQLVAGDVDGAVETQKRCGKALSNMADGIPVVGHVKGGIHYLAGDEEGGERAMKSATRTTGVLAGGAAGFVVGGPVGAVAGGISGGALFDTAATVVDSEIHNEFRPSGYIASLKNVVDNPNPGDVFDLAFMPVADGFAGYGAGQMVKNLQGPSTSQPKVSQTNLAKAQALESQAVAAMEAAEASKMSVPNMEYIVESNKAQSMWNQAQQLKGKPNVPFDPKATSSSAASSTQAAAVLKPDSSKTKVEPKRKIAAVAPQQKQEVQTSSSASVGRKNRRKPDDEDDEKKRRCICSDMKLRVLFLNARSLNPTNRTLSFEQKLQRIRNLIRSQNPHIVAFAETWLTEGHSNIDIVSNLGLEGYTIFRQDRSQDSRNNAYQLGPTRNPLGDRRGGGILIACRQPDFLLTFKRNCAEDYFDCIINIEMSYSYNCKTCNNGKSKGKFGFVVVYRRPGAGTNEDKEEYDRVNGEIIDRLAHLSSYYPTEGYDGFAMVGDFNWSTDNWDLDYVRGYANVLLQLSRPATHEKGDALDHVICYPPQFVSGGGVGVTDAISDHSALIFDLKIAKDYKPGNVCRYCSDR